MRHILALLTLASLVTACSPAPSKETASESQAGSSVLVAETARSSIEIPAAVSSAAISSSDGTCLSEIGKAASDRLVERCIMVSPATHPPCNAANSCQMIQSEIDRSCAMYGPEEKKPTECAA